jgi:hypothetical protein
MLAGGLWTGHDIVQTGSEWEGCGDGAQACESERLDHNFSYWAFMGVCR